jgi:hypothetical protein
MKIFKISIFKFNKIIKYILLNLFNKKINFKMICNLNSFKIRNNMKKIIKAKVKFINLKFKNLVLSLNKKASKYIKKEKNRYHNI